jgi:hypothetical protein
MPDEIPFEVDNAEAILRAVRHPAHVKDGKRGSGPQLKTAFLKALSGTDDVSVMRLTYMGFESCRARARQMPQYIGVATLKVARVRAHASEVIDSREEFMGHAHIAHGVVLPNDEPPNSEIQEQLNERIRGILKGVPLIVDPDPTNEAWRGMSVAEIQGLLDLM